MSNKDSNSLGPGESKLVTVRVPKGARLDNAKIVVTFGCGRCGRTMSATLAIPVVGGLIEKTCECGAEIKLQLGPAEVIEIEDG